MKLQQSTSHSGTTLATALHAKLIKQQVTAQRQGTKLPDPIVHTILAYAQRNAHAFNVKALHTCCPACLKAHITAETRKYNIPDVAAQIVLRAFPGAVGHEGYYLDEGQLLQIDDF
jgi:hypothetical protein